MIRTIEQKAEAPIVKLEQGWEHDRERFLWALEVTRRGGKSTSQLGFHQLPTKIVLDVKGSEESKKDVNLHRLHVFLSTDTPEFTAPAPKRKYDSHNQLIVCTVFWVEGGLPIKRQVSEIWIHVPGRKPVVMTGKDLPRSISLVVDVTVPALDVMHALTGEPVTKKGIEAKVIPLLRHPKTAVAVAAAMFLGARFLSDGITRAYGF